MEDLRSSEVQTSSFDGSGGSSQFLEECDIRILDKAGCGTEERDQKLQGDRAHIGDVEVVCDSYNFRKEKEPRVQAAARVRS